MQKKYLTLGCFFLSTILAYAQVPTMLWQHGWGNAEYDIQPSLITDTDNNVYVTGQFKGLVDFDPGPGTAVLDASFLTHTYIVKFNAAGEFQWVKEIGNEIHQARTIAYDPDGFIYLHGQYLGATDFNPGAGNFTLTPPNNSYDGFILKLDLDGNFVWATSIGGNGQEFSGVVTIDPQHNVIVSGVFTGISDFHPGAEELIFNAEGNFRTDNYVVKYDAAGNFIWAKQLAGDGMSSSSGVDTDGSGNIYFSGFFDGSRDFDPGAGMQVLTFSGPWDGFLASYDTDGNYRWAHRVGGNGDDWVNGIHVQDDGIIHATGYFSATADFDPGPDSVKFTAINTDVFVMKLDHTGSFIWARQVGDISFDQGRAITVDAEKNVYVTGWYAETVDFDPGPGEFFMTSTGANDMDDAYIFRLDEEGEFDWAYTLGGLDNDEGHRVQIDNDGHLLLSGVYRATAGFYPGNNGQDSLMHRGSADAFLVKWKQCSPALFNTEIIHFENTLISQQQAGSYQWVDCDNNFLPVANGTNQSYVPIASGNYAVILTEDDCSVTTSCVQVILSSTDDLSQTKSMILPNPSDGNAVIDLGSFHRRVGISIHDLTGQLIRSEEYFDATHIPVSGDLPSGSYIVSVRKDNQAENLKLCVMRN